MANVDPLIQNAIAAIKANRRAEGRQLLEQILAHDEHNEQAWLWLSGCVDTLEEQKICLENVIAINPQNHKAIRGLDALTKKMSGGSAPAPSSSRPSSNAGPFGGVDPFAGSPFDSVGSAPSTASSADWNRGSAPALGSGKNVQLPSDEEYDAWLANLPLGGGSSSTGEVFTPASDFNVANGPFSAASSSYGNDDPYAGLENLYSSPNSSNDYAAPIEPAPSGGGVFGGYDSNDMSSGYGNAPVQDIPPAMPSYDSGFSYNNTYAPPPAESSSFSSGTTFSFKNPKNAEPVQEPGLGSMDGPFSGPSESLFAGIDDSSPVSSGSGLAFSNDIDVDPNEDVDFTPPASKVGLSTAVPGSASLFTGSKTASAFSGGLVLGSSAAGLPTDQAFRLIPAEIQLVDKTPAEPGMRRMVMILGVITILAFVALLINILTLGS